MIKTFVAATALTALLGANAANATLSYSSSVGGAPTGVTLDNLDSLNLGSASQTSSKGILFSFNPDAAVVSGSNSGVYAAPNLSGGNGQGFGSPNQANGLDTTHYVTSGSTGSFSNASVTMILPTAEKYFGLLWGSVDDYNTLSFYNSSNNLIGTLTGSQVIAVANGSQGPDGTVYVNINSDLAFTKIIATSSQHAFEFDNVAFNPTVVNVPEPASLALLGAGLFGLGMIRRRRQSAA